jgi:hypothetical protein
MKRAICSLQLLLLGGLMPLAAQCTDAQDMRYQGVYEGPMSGGIKGVINLVVSGTRVSGSALGSFGLNKSSAGSDPATFRAPSFTGTLDCATGTITMPVVSPAFKEDDRFTGEFTGTIQVNSQVSSQGAQREPYAGTSRTEEGGYEPPEKIASGTWSVSNKRITCSGSWSASTRRGYTGSSSDSGSVPTCSDSAAPPPGQEGGGTVTANPPAGPDSAGHISAAPPGLDGAGEVPGPASLLEAVIGIVAPGLLAVLTGLKYVLEGGTAAVPPPAPPTTAPLPPPPPPPPGPPAEIDYTYPDGRRTSLVFDPKYGGYVNALTGGLIMPEEVGAWSNRQQEIINNVQDWRARNDSLQQTGQDALSQELNRIRQEDATRQALLTRVSEMEKAVFEGRGGLNGLIEPPGSPGDVMGRLRDLTDQINSGGKFDQRLFDATTRVVRDRMSGKAIAPSEMPKPQGNWETFKDGFIETTRQMASSTDADGNFSWLSVAGRVGAAVITLGGSEGIIGAKEYVDGGGTSAIKGALQVAGVNGLMTVLGLGAAKAAGGILKGGAVIGQALATEGAEAIVQAAKNGSSAAQALVRAGQGAQRVGQALYNGGGKSVIDGLTKVKQVLTTDLRRSSGPSVPGRPPVTDGQISGRNPTYVRDPRAKVSLQGIPAETQAHLSQTAQQTGNKIYVRPNSPETAQRLAEGCHPKTSNIHNKTIKDFETLLGAPPNSEGLVGHYKPKLPKFYHDLPPKVQEKLVTTYHARWREYTVNNAEIRLNPELLVKNGLIHSSATGKAYTGDVDLWDVRSGTGGKLDAGSYNSTMDQITGGGCAINHNPQAVWDYSNSSRILNSPGGMSDFEMNQAIDCTILKSHQLGRPGSQPLIVYNPDGTVEGVFIRGGALE